MKKANLLVVVLLGLAVSGCALLEQATEGDTAYRAGRAITVAYLIKKAKLEPEQVAAIEAIHQALADVTVTIEIQSVDTYIDRLEAKLREGIKDEIEERLAIHLLKPYLDAIKALIPEQIGVSLRCKALQDFQRGVLNARKDYAFLL